MGRSVSLPWGKVKRDFLLLSVGFVAGSIAGAVVVLLNPAGGGRLFQYIARTIAGKISRKSAFSTFLGIYLNNLGVATSAYALGIFFGVVPWLVVLVNGFILGAVVAYILRAHLMGATTVILGLLPHGVIEIPAIILAAASGVLLYRGTLKREGMETVYASLKFYVLSALLLLLAAFIEAFITPRVAGIG
ncbi:stage II sporulation protein M [Thermococcus sp.]|uniref:stage II sporulation protein M n=1 Tax=Thermococcus sp. TaxID=35749 RepID=UPI002611C667|nr:stage II sporulation protein M [Thermococcus sp.]